MRKVQVRGDGSLGQASRGGGGGWTERKQEIREFRVQNKQGLGQAGLAATRDHSPPAGPRAHLLALGADLDGVGDQLGCLFLLQTRHFLQLDGNLKTRGRSEAAPACPPAPPWPSGLTVVSQRKMLL